MTRLSRAKLVDIVKRLERVDEEAAERIVDRITYRRKRIVVPKIFDYRPQKAESIRLVHGRYSANPGEVLCPYYRRRCKHLPTLLLKHHSKPGLALWQCKGCTSFLIRIQKSF